MTVTVLHTHKHNSREFTQPSFIHDHKIEEVILCHINFCFFHSLSLSFPLFRPKCCSFSEMLYPSCPPPAVLGSFDQPHNNQHNIFRHCRMPILNRIDVHINLRSLFFPSVVVVVVVDSFVSSIPADLVFRMIFGTACARIVYSR